MELETSIGKLVNEAIAENESLFLVGVKVKGNTGNQKVLIFIDGDNGLSIDECSWASRKIGGALEEADIFNGKYILEVSSPGLDYPLTLPRQYKKNIGRNLVVETTSENTIEGVLLKVENDYILLKKEEKEHKLNFEKIKEAKVKISFK